jgi:hypothetical protein
MLMYLIISVSSFLTLYAARETGPFWSSAPHTALATASVASLTITTLLASFWPPNVLTGIPLLGLARRDALARYTLWPLWGLLWCVILFLVQDALKVAAWRAIDRFDLFQYRTGALVGARGAHDFAAAPPGAGGAVEGRLLDFRAAGAEGEAASLARASVAAGRDPAPLRTAEAGLRAARAAVGVARDARFDGAAVVVGDAEAGGGDPVSAAAAAAATPGLTDDERRALEADVGGMRRASAALETVLSAEREQRGRRGGGGAKPAAGTCAEK